MPLTCAGCDKPIRSGGWCWCAKREGSLVLCRIMVQAARGRQVAQLYTNPTRWHQACHRRFHAAQRALQVAALGGEPCIGCDGTGVVREAWQWDRDCFACLGTGVA